MRVSTDVPQEQQHRAGVRPSTIYPEMRHRWNPTVTGKAVLVSIAGRISQGRVSRRFHKERDSSSKEKRDDFKEPQSTCWVVMFHSWIYWPSPWGCWVSFFLSGEVILSCDAVTLNEVPLSAMHLQFRRWTIHPDSRMMATGQGCDWHWAADNNSESVVLW